MNVLVKIFAGFQKFFAGILIGLVRLYKTWISPMIGPHCRFEPTCSDYFIESVKKRGILVGSLRGIWRICRCHPWSRGGYDPP
ncbi:MAG: membrane protein insertion efficiency factor YidD [Pirellulales bacterium]|nr:membrane protein insertion efficiency factor YidD [Pirellulales bacterium]